MNDIVDLTVAVIAKQCLPGKVKTRLSPPLSPADAARLASTSLAQTLDTVRRLPVTHRLLVMDGTASDAESKGFRVLPQSGGGLAERLAAVCDSCAGPLLIIGMDTPHVTAEHLAPLLRDWSAARPVHDAWLGPADDGGFWALALRRPDGRLIRGVPMSSAHTGAEQLARFVDAGLSIGELPRLTDMDYFADALHIASVQPGTEFAAAVQALQPAGQQTRASQEPLTGQQISGRLGPRSGQHCDQAERAVQSAGETLWNSAMGTLGPSREEP